MDLIVIQRWCQFQVMDRGKLNRWLGPALRGLLVKPLRNRLCILPAGEQARRSASSKTEDLYCRGCLQNGDCLYGRSLEPDLMVLKGETVRGARDGLRALTIGAGLLPEHECAQGLTVLVRWLAIGCDALQILDEAQQVLNAQLEQKGLGPQRLRMRCDLDKTVDRQLLLNRCDLPVERGDARVPQLSIQLDSPLLLKTRPASSSFNAERRFQPQRELTFESLLAESVRTVRRAIGEYVDWEWAKACDLRELMKLEEPIHCSYSEILPFEQDRQSARQGASWSVRGVTGTLAFDYVPMSFLPWLAWAGRLGIGDSRNCGAGLMSIGI